MYFLGSWLLKQILKQIKGCAKDNVQYNLADLISTRHVTTTRCGHNCGICVAHFVKFHALVRYL